MWKKGISEFLSKWSFVFRVTWGFFHLFLLNTMSSKRTKEWVYCHYKRSDVSSLCKYVSGVACHAGMVQGVSWISDHSLTIFRWQWILNHPPWVFACFPAAGLPPRAPLQALLALHPAPSFASPIVSLEHQVPCSRHLMAFPAQDCLMTSSLSYLYLCKKLDLLTLQIDVFSDWLTWRLLVSSWH